MLASLNEQNCLGPKLPLICPRHPEVDLEVGQQCHHVCNARLDCGHACHQPCHREGHHPDCDQEVVVTLPCGHERSCKCSERECAAEKLKCSKLVEFRHDVCQHADTRKCWDKKKKCETTVMMRCDMCGEESSVQCYIKKDCPENFRCSKPCTRKMSCHSDYACRILFLTRSASHPLPQAKLKSTRNSKSGYHFKFGVDSSLSELRLFIWISGICPGHHACKLPCHDDCEKGLDDCELCALESW